ncbi:hypothetical protein GGF31_007675 [Allomyces arbusculus]|nr:hypothetical protein GGF31_007675 [Allomyces arbusculus]
MVGLSHWPHGTTSFKIQPVATTTSTAAAGTTTTAMADAQPPSPPPATGAAADEPPAAAAAAPPATDLAAVSLTLSATNAATPAPLDLAALADAPTANRVLAALVYAAIAHAYATDPTPWAGTCACPPGVPQPRTKLLRAISAALGPVLDDRATALLAEHGLLDAVGASNLDANATVRNVLVAIVLLAAEAEILTGTARLELPRRHETLFRILWGVKDYVGWCVDGQVPGDADHRIPLALVHVANGEETNARMRWAVAPEPTTTDLVAAVESEAEFETETALAPDPHSPAPEPLSPPPPPAMAHPPSPSLDTGKVTPAPRNLAPVPPAPAAAPPTLKRRTSRQVIPVVQVEIKVSRNSSGGVVRRRSMPPPARTPVPPPAAPANDEDPMAVDDVPAPNETNEDVDVAMADADAKMAAQASRTDDRDRDRDYPPPPPVADHAAVGENAEQQQPPLRRSRRSARARSGGDSPAPAATAATASAQGPPRPKWWITPSTQPPAIMQAPRRPPPPGAFSLYIPRANAVLLQASSTLRVAIHDLTDRFHYILTQPINARSKNDILDTLRGHLAATLKKAGRKAAADTNALTTAIRDLDQVAQFLAAATARAALADRGLDRVMTVLAYLGVAVPATLDAVLEPLMGKVAEAYKAVEAVKGAKVEYAEVGSVLDEKWMQVWGGWGVGEGVRRVAFACAPRIVVPPGEGFEDRRARVVVYTVVRRGNGGANGGGSGRRG